MARRTARSSLAVWLSFVVSAWLAPFGGAGVARAAEPAAAPAGPSPGQKAEAQKAFETASRHFDGRHFDQALSTFRASYAVVPSPNTRLMIARCLRELGREGEAYAEYDAVIREAREKGERYANAAQAGTDEQAELRAQVALVTVRLSAPHEGVSVKIGDRALDPSQLGTAVAVPPGAIVVTASAPDGTSARAETNVPAGVAGAVVLELTATPQSASPAPAAGPVVVRPPAEPPQSLRTLAFVSGGVGVVGVSLFAVFGAMSRSKYSDLESACPAKKCPAREQDTVDSGEAYQAVANVGLGVGIIGLGLGTTLFFLEPSGSEVSASSARLRVDVGPGAVVARGAF